MRLYVATSFSNIPEARRVMATLREAGHTITHDWTHEKLDPAWPKAQQAEYLQSCGARDFLGVTQADVVVLVNHAKSRDAMAEFGVALGLGKKVVVLYPERRSSVFFHRAVCVASVLELLTALRFPAYGRAS